MQRTKSSLWRTPRVSSKQAQIAIFLIITVFLIASTTVVVVVVNKESSRTVARSQLETFAGGFSLSEFRTYLQSCLETSAQDGLYIFGKQGGVFYEEQEGSAIDFPVLGANTTAVDNDFSILFLTDSRVRSTVASAPHYPCFSESSGVSNPALKGEECYRNYSHNMPGASFLFSTSFQEVNKTPSTPEEFIPPLCNRVHYFNQTVVNTFNQEVVQQIIICDPSPSDPFLDYSYESQLESYITHFTSQCFFEGKDLLADQLEADISLDGDFEVDTFFSDDYTAFSLSFPLLITYEDEQEERSIEEFYIQTPVRLKVLYALLYGNNVRIKTGTGGFWEITSPESLLSQDFNDIAFDLQRDYLELLKENNLYDITIDRFVDSYGSIVRVTDTASLLFGKPYEFYFRMYNRKPALNYLTLNSRGSFDLYAYADDYLIFDPEGYDLDDSGSSGGDLLYTYEILDPSWQWRTESFYTNALYQTGRDGNITCLHDKYGITESRCVGFRLNASDIGDHQIRIWLNDSESGDYQDISLFIDQRPNITFTVHHLYNDSLPEFVPGKGFIVSSEDPFILNTSESLVSLYPGSIRRFTWVDTEHLTYNPSFCASFFFRDDPLCLFFVGDLFRAIPPTYPLEFDPFVETIVHPGLDPYTDYSFLSDFLTYPFPLDPSHTQILSLLSDPVVSSFYEVFNISRGIGYPIPNTTNPKRFSSILLNYTVDGITMEDYQQPIYIAECLPHRSETPSHPFNLLNSLGSEKELVPYHANHTCCEGDASDDPSLWRIAPAGTPCYSRTEMGTWNEFMLDPATNESLTLMKKNSPGDASSLSMDIIPPIDPNFDRYVRVIEGECNGKRGNTCNVSQFAIQKIPYCGQILVPNDLHYYLWRNPLGVNYTVQATSLPMKWYRASFPYEYKLHEGYYNSTLCLARHNSQPLLLNTSDTTIMPDFETPINELYSCFDEDGLPSHLSKYPCTMRKCYHLDSTSINTRFTFFNRPLSFRVFQFPLYFGHDPSYCQCGNSVAHLPTESAKFCCNPGPTSFEVHSTLSACQGSIIDADLDGIDDYDEGGYVYDHSTESAYLPCQFEQSSVGLSYEDHDSDGDRVPDYLESNTEDLDNDGIVDVCDTDDDGDGIQTTFEYTSFILDDPLEADFDQDGTPDFRDFDDDNDGTLTRDEFGTCYTGSVLAHSGPALPQAQRQPQRCTATGSAPHYGCCDVDNDGIADHYEDNTVDVNSNGYSEPYDHTEYFDETLYNQSLYTECMAKDYSFIEYCEDFSLIDNSSCDLSDDPDACYQLIDYHRAFEVMFKDNTIDSARCADEDVNNTNVTSYRRLCEEIYDTSLRDCEITGVVTAPDSSTFVKTFSLYFLDLDICKHYHTGIGCSSSDSECQLLTSLIHSYTLSDPSECEGRNTDLYHQAICEASTGAVGNTVCQDFKGRMCELYAHGKTTARSPSSFCTGYSGSERTLCEAFSSPFGCGSLTTPMYYDICTTLLS